ncbi:MAG: hypothetical protein QOC96_3329 [Acidobacteriota bacterium]|nr:hypothetical protein [Acidobacteriota bacterium]
MRRSVGIAIFVLGLLVLLAGILKVVQGMTGISILMIVVGLAIFGLSFIPQPDPGPDAPPPMSPAERIIGVFYEPSPVFKNLRCYPRWLAAFLVLMLCGVTYQLAFTQRVTPERMAAETADRRIEGGFVPPEKATDYKAQLIEDAKLPVSRIKDVVGQIGGGFLFLLVLAGLYLLCVLAFGGRMNFWQAFSVAIYGSLPPIVITTILSLILLYTKSPEDLDVIKDSRGLARADLGLLFALAEHPYLHIIGSFIGIFSLYGWWVTVSGLHNTATKLSKASAWTIAFLLWLLGLVLVLILAAIFPSFFR